MWSNDVRMRRHSCGVFTGDNVVPERGLTRYELELMNVLWDRGQATVQEVCDSLDRKLAYTTVMTTLNLLATRKNVLSRKKQGRAYLYRPVVTREEVSRSFLSDLKEILFGNRLPSLVLHLMAEGETTGKEAEILREALRKLEEK